jgi:glycine/D-amino acid oxidase-like deaminating enzyme
MLRIDEVQDSASLPEKVDVVVIGGGIIGTSTAYELARRGVAVALLEKGFVGAEQSGRNWGWVRQQNRDYQELPIAMRSLQRWGELEREIGYDLGFRREGILYATTDQAELARLEEWNKGAREIGFISHVLSGDEVRSRLPNSTPQWRGGVWSPSDGKAEPSKAAPAIAEGAKKLGVSLHQSCAIRALDISAGRVTGVWTEQGLVKASMVVCAAGAWSSRLCRRYGVEIPIANIVGTTMRTSVAPEVTSGCVYGPGFALRRRLDGGYTLAVPGYGRMELAPQGIRNSLKFYKLFRSNLAKKLKIRIGRSFFNGPDAISDWNEDERSPFEEMRVLDPLPDNEWIKVALEKVTTTLPELKGIRVIQTWAGMIDTTPDLVPVISATPKVPGLIIASGFSGHGFGLGPAAGMLTADLVTNKTPFADVTPFRLERFEDGTAGKAHDMM